MKPVHVHLDPLWRVSGPGGQALSPRVMGWLLAIPQHGSLSAACQAQGASYRHAWALLREAEAALGAPLVHMARGQGATLTPLGEALVWAQRRVEARLRPQLDSLAFELQAELQRVLSGTERPLRVCASHGFAIEALQRLLGESGEPLDWRYTDSSQALAALHAGQADVASLHLPVKAWATRQRDGTGGEPHSPQPSDDRNDLQREVLRAHARWLRPDWRYVHLVTRRQGLMVRAGNPLQIDGVADLLRPDVRFVARAPGSGTRLLLEALLRRAGHDPARLADGASGEHTHSAIAAHVASGMADAGFGVETSARRFGLEFIPVQTERYGLLVSPEGLQQPAVQRMLALLRGAAFQQTLEGLPGYRLDACGQVMPAAEVFEAWPG